MQSHDDTLLDRRAFLVLTGAGATGLAMLSATSWLYIDAQDRAWTRTVLDETGARDQALPRAAQRARERDVPLLVMLDDPAPGEDGGSVWGAFLDLASNATHARLALCELVFASTQQLYQLARERGWMELVCDGDARPLGWVVSTEECALRRIEVSLPPPEDWVCRDPKREPEVRAWVEVFEAEVCAALAIEDASVDHAARGLANVVGSSHGECERALASRSRLQLAESAPAGAKWAHGWNSCGVSNFEDGTHTSEIMTCGAGCTPPRARHFLWLYTTDRR